MNLGEPVTLVRSPIMRKPVEPVTSSDDADVCVNELETVDDVCVNECVSLQLHLSEDAHEFLFSSSSELNVVYCVAEPRGDWN